MQSDEEFEIEDRTNEEAGVVTGDVDIVDDESDDEIEVIDEASAVFTGHAEAVLCCAVSSDSQYMVSGGQDDTAFVLNNELQVLFECKGHSDSVIAVGFNSSNSCVATGDMKGLIQVWDVATGRQNFEYDLSEDLLWMMWHPVVNNILLVGTSSGSSLLLKTTDGHCKYFASSGASSVCGRFCHDGKRAVICYDDGYIRLWDLKSEALLSSTEVHKGTITALDIKKDDSLVASASVDGTAKLLNVSSSRVLASLNCCNPDAEETDSVETVSFCDNLSVLATGTALGAVTIWDISTQKKRNVCATDVGVSKLIFDANNSHVLYTAGLDGEIRAFDSRSGKLEFEKSGHTQEILDFCVASDSSFLFTASEDTSCRTFSLKD